MLAAALPQDAASALPYAALAIAPLAVVAIVVSLDGSAHTVALLDVLTAVGSGVRGKAELWMLCAYGAVASYVFGLLTNLWFWPFAVGAGTGISYVPGAPLGTNLSSFLLYSLVTSTAGWDTLRAVTTIVGIILVGRAVLAAFRRVKPVSTAGTQASKAQSAHAKDRLQLEV